MSNSEVNVLPAGRREKMSRLRLLIAERMHSSSTTTAPVTLTTEVDATQMVAFRSAAKAAGRVPVPSYNAILVKALGRVLVQHPTMNASIDGNDLVCWEAVHVGIAMDTPRGLLVPVVRDVNDRPLAEVAKEIERFASAASTGKVPPDDLQGGTFTITNLGSYDVDFFTPIINYPQVGILGVGRIRDVFEMQSGQLGQRKRMFLSLTFDHRAIDGGPAARFLQELKKLIECQPAWLEP